MDGTLLTKPLGQQRMRINSGFALDCKDMGFLGTKECNHHWKNVQNNKINDYILFPSICYHHGYYNDDVDNIVFSSQFFTRLTIDPDTERLHRSFTQGQDFIEGRVDESKLLDVRNDLFHNWNTMYYVDEFPPCSQFDGAIVDRESHRQIYDTKFDQVLLIKILLDTFVALFPYLSINMVWLLCKSKPGDGFQGWHRDLALGVKITKTIVMNLDVIPKEKPVVAEADSAPDNAAVTAADIVEATVATGDDFSVD